MKSLWHVKRVSLWLTCRHVILYLNILFKLPHHGKIWYSVWEQVGFWMGAGKGVFTSTESIKDNGVCSAHLF